ncbi:MAG: TatD family hydrolase [Spirochaetia bacterium]
MGAIIVVDVHAHFFSLQKQLKKSLEFDWPVIFSSHGEKEISALQNYSTPHVFRSVGIHPQDPNPYLVDIVENAVKSGKFCAIGEIGLDQFLPFKESFCKQKEIFYTQLELASYYQLPVILHIRKSMSDIFSSLYFLKKCPAVIFHSYAGSLTEAQSLLKSINAYFSFGTPILWGAKQANLCIEQLPLERLFLETDAPWQSLRNQDFTPLSMIHTLYEYCAKKRGVCIENIQEILYHNFQEILSTHKTITRL